MWLISLGDAPKHENTPKYGWHGTVPICRRNFGAIFALSGIPVCPFGFRYVTWHTICTDMPPEIGIYPGFERVSLIGRASNRSKAR